MEVQAVEVEAAEVKAAEVEVPAIVEVPEEVIKEVMEVDP